MEERVKRKLTPTEIAIVEKIVGFETRVRFVSDYGNDYLVSETGEHVFTLKLHNGMYVRDPPVRPLAIYRLANGANVALSNEMGRRMLRVHRLVAMAFISKPPGPADSYDVVHKDGNKLNNHYRNLRWREDNRVEPEVRRRIYQFHDHGTRNVAIARILGITADTVEAVLHSRRNAPEPPVMGTKLPCRIEQDVRDSLPRHVLDAILLSAGGRVRVRFVPGYPEYLVSEDGKHLFSLRLPGQPRGDGIACLTELKIRTTRQGAVVSLKTEGRAAGRRVSRIVAETFLPQPQPGEYDVIHKDGNIRNNCWTNLEWTPRIHHPRSVIQQVWQLHHEGKRNCEIEAKLGLKLNAVTVILHRGMPSDIHVTHSSRQGAIEPEVRAKLSPGELECLVGKVGENTRVRFIPGHPHYLVSEDGRHAFSVVARTRKAPWRTSLVSLVICANSIGHPAVNVGSARVHGSRLVAKAFLQNPGPGCFHVEHADGDKTNNHYTNLRWQHWTRHSAQVVDRIHELHDAGHSSRDIDRLLEMKKGSAASILSRRETDPLNTGEEVQSEIESAVKERLPANVVTFIVANAGPDQRVRFIPGDPDYLVSEDGEHVFRVTVEKVKKGSRVHMNRVSFYVAPHSSSIRSVHLMRSRKQVRVLVRWAVAKAFLDDPGPGDFIVVNLDGNARNNHWRNLAWRPRC